jgi:hypothetical protein
VHLTFASRCCAIAAVPNRPAPVAAQPGAPDLSVAFGTAWRAEQTLAAMAAAVRALVRMVASMMATAAGATSL